MDIHSLTVGNKKNDNRPVVWIESSDSAFLQCKEQLAKAALLYHPKPAAEGGLFTDASDHAVGAALNQKVDGHWQPLAFYSEKLSEAQKNYSAYDRELTAIYQSIKHFQDIPMGRCFEIYTDHSHFHSLSIPADAVEHHDKFVS